MSVISSSLLRVGGRLGLFFQVWTFITGDAWVLQTIQGFQIEFFGYPYQPIPPRPITFSAEDAVLVDQEVQSLLAKGAIARTLPHPRGFISNLFLVDKADGGQRPVINLREFNEWLVYRHFKMEGIHLLQDLLRPGDWMARLDLKEAYLSISIFPPHRRFLQFHWGNQTYEFTTLPFGLSSALWCFTKVLRPVVERLRALGIRLTVYLDDILLMAQCPRTLSQQLHTAVNLLQGLGFVINETKSTLVPSQMGILLGFCIESVVATFSLPSRKVTKIRHEIQRALSKPCISLRQVARIVGLLSSSIQAIFPGPLHYWALQRMKADHLRKGSVVFPTGLANSGGQGGAYLVASQHGSLEWESDMWLSSRFSHRVRCQQGRLGGKMWRVNHQRSMVATRTTTYKLFRTPSGVVCDPILDQGLHSVLRTPQAGQRICGQIHQPPRRNSVQGPLRSGSKLLAIVSRPPEFSHGRVPAWSGQSSGGLSVTPFS